MKRFFRNYLKEFVYGALDGTVTTFAIIAGSAGANLPSSVVLILGISNVLADAFSMASSNYLSEKSDRDMSEKVATVNPLYRSFATFGSFVVVGCISLIPYLLNLIFGIWGENTFFISCIFTSFAFIFIGQIRGRITRKNKLLSVIETLVVGGVAASVAYFVGAGLDKIIN